MTAPVSPPAPPATRATPTSDSGGRDSAEPFASALDGALGAGRPAVDGAGAQAGGDASADQEDADAATEAPAEPGAAAPGGVVAALWALLSGAAKGATATDAEAAAAAKGTPVAAGHADGIPPGLAVAQAARAAGGIAHGLNGTQPGQPAKGTPVATPDAATPAAATAAPPPPAAAVDAARAAAEALAAAGVQAIVPDAAGAPGTDDAMTAPLTTAGAVAAPVATPAPTDDGTAPAATPSASAGVLPVAGEEAAGGSATGTGSDSGRGPGEESTARTDAVATGQSGPAGPTASVTRAEAGTGTAVAQPVSGQIAKQVAVLRGGPDGSHTMTVVLTPENLGPVEVSVTVSQGALELTLRGAHEHGRAALLDAVPDLRRDLEAAGLTCSRLDVDRGTRDGGNSPSQQNSGRPGEQGPGGRGSQHDRTEHGARPWERPADRGEGPPATSRIASGLDIRV